jgi:ketosteroid isomerase-like protein
MSTETNKQLITHYFQAVNRGDGEAIRQLLHKDFVFRGMGRHPDWMRYVWGPEAFADAPRDMSTKMTKPIVMNLLGMIAEGERIAVQADSYGEMKNGKIYDNAYHFVFTFDDGKIKEVQEYCCTYTVFEVFGEYIDPARAGVKSSPV